MPLAFLPLRGRFLWLSLLPGFVLTLLTTAYEPTVSIAFQYSAYLIALTFPASALALEELGRRGARELRAAVFAVLAGTLLTTTAWGAIPPRSHFMAGFAVVNFEPLSDREREKKEDLDALAALVPPSASMAASENELPHVSGREKCYDLKDGIFGADFLLYDKNSGEMGAKRAKEALARGKYQRVAARGSVVLLARRARP